MSEKPQVSTECAARINQSLPPPFQLSLLFVEPLRLKGLVLRPAFISSQCSHEENVDFAWGLSLIQIPFFTLPSPSPHVYINHPSDLLLHGISEWRGIFAPELCPSLSQRPLCFPCLDVTILHHLSCKSPPPFPPCLCLKAFHFSLSPAPSTSWPWLTTGTAGFSVSAGYFMACLPHDNIMAKGTSCRFSLCPTFKGGLGNAELQNSSISPQATTLVSCTSFSYVSKINTVFSSSSSRRVRASKSMYKAFSLICSQSLLRIRCSSQQNQGRLDRSTVRGNI